MADTAKDIYKNSTIEMTTLVRLLMAREKADVDGNKRWHSQLSVSGNKIDLHNPTTELPGAGSRCCTFEDGVQPDRRHDDRSDSAVAKRTGCG